MVLVGLTGSIGTGKSTLTHWLRGEGYSVFDADGCVHDLYENEAVPLVEAAFPTSTKGGKVDRVVLMNLLAGQKKSFEKLENIIHPLVTEKKKDFVRQCLASGQKICFFDIPLLFETNQQNLFDYNVVLSVWPDIQEQRVLQRSGMTSEKLALILARQIPDSQKKLLADFVIENNGSLSDLIIAWKKVMPRFLEKAGERLYKWDL